MTTLLARPVIANRYWILRRDDKKIGEVEAVADGFTVKIDNRVMRYKTIRMAKRDANIEFEPAPKTRKSTANTVHGFEVVGRVYNALWDVKNQLPLYTKSAKSKSWFAAGWYRVRQHRDWRVVRDPKLITLQRYEYQGPFHSQCEAESVASAHAA